MKWASIHVCPKETSFTYSCTVGLLDRTRTQLLAALDKSTDDAFVDLGLTRFGFV